MFGGGAGPSARLSARMRQREGLTYGVGTGMMGSPLDTVVAFTGSATAAPENMDRIERAFREELDRIYREGFTEEEIAKAKSGLLQQRMQSRSNDESLAGSWADRLHRGRTFAEAAESDARIRALTRDEVNAAARKYLDPSKVSIVRVGTFAP